MKHLKLFNNESYYNAWLSSDNFVTPYVSKIKNNGSINYQKHIKLPYDAEIEYLKSSSSSYIDTDINITYQLLNNAEHIEYITDTKFLSNGAEGKNKLYLFVGLNNNGQFYSGLGNTYNSNSSIQNDQQRHIVKLEKKNGRVVLTIDDQVAHIYDYVDAGYRDGMTTNSFYLFKCADFDSGAIQEKYYAKLTIDDNVLFEMIPVRINDVGYMYDTVRKRLFGTKTNPFILGPDI